MKKLLLLFASVNFLSIALLLGQVDTKRTNFYKDTDIPCDNSILLSVKNPISRFNFAKFELKINNKSENFVMYKPEESVLKFYEGEFNPEENENGYIIYPSNEKSPTVKVDNGKTMCVKEFEFNVGGIYTFPTVGEVAYTHDFHLPVSKNSFESGHFKIVMTKLKKQTDETAIQFKCTYFGDKIGLLSPSKAVIRTADNTEWANARSSDKIKVLFKGETRKFTIIFKIPRRYFDMQFAEMDVLWKDVFSEVEPTRIEIEPVNIIIDEVKTAEKN